jgi:hypothetical protein
MTAQYVPTPADIAAGQVSIILTTNDPDGSGPCLAARDTMKVTFQNSINPVAVSGPTGVCRPVNGVVFSVPAVAGATYAWTVPTNVVIASGQGTNSISANWPSNGQAGNVCVTVSNGCNSVLSCLNVNLRTAVPGTVSSIKGFTSACRNEVLKYSCTRVSSADFYVWTPPVGATINGSTAPFSTVDTFVVVTFGPTYTGDTLRVVGGNCKGLSATQRKLRINRRTTVPAATSSIFGESKGVCGETLVYFVKKNTSAVTYTWRTTVAGALINGLPSPQTTTDTLVTIDWPSTSGGGSLFVRANNACGSSAEKSVTITTIPATPTTITGRDTVCANATEVYVSSSVFGATNYTWTVPSGILIQGGQGTTSVTIKFNGTLTTRAIRVNASNACGASTNKTLNVVVKSCPRIGEFAEADMFNMDVYPNPATELLNIRFNSETAGDYNMLMTDISGRIVRNENFNAVEGENNATWDVSGYNSGIYFLILQGQHGKSQVRLIIE